MYKGHFNLKSKETKTKNYGTTKLGLLQIQNLIIKNYVSIKTSL